MIDTVKLVAANSTVGVPVIDPVLVFRVNPLGSAGLIAKVRVPTPPDPVTGVKAEAANNLVRDVDATAKLLTSVACPASTVRLNVLLPTCPAASVNVIT